MYREDRFNMIFKDLKDTEQKNKLKKSLFAIEDLIREMGYEPW